MSKRLVLLKLNSVKTPSQHPIIPLEELDRFSRGVNIWTDLLWRQHPDHLKRTDVWTVRTEKKPFILVLGPPSRRVCLPSDAGVSVLSGSAQASFSLGWSRDRSSHEDTSPTKAGLVWTQMCPSSSRCLAELFSKQEERGMLGVWSICLTSYGLDVRQTHNSRSPTPSCHQRASGRERQTPRGSDSAFKLDLNGNMIHSFPLKTGIYMLIIP